MSVCHSQSSQAPAVRGGASKFWQRCGASIINPTRHDHRIIGLFWELPLRVSVSGVVPFNLVVCGAKDTDAFKFVESGRIID